MNTAWNPVKTGLDLLNTGCFFLLSHDHDGGREELPAEVPELGGLPAGHLLDAVAEPLGAEEPADGDRLEEADPEKGHAGGRVEVHQVEEEHATLKNKKTFKPVYRGWVSFPSDLSAHWKPE